MCYTNRHYLYLPLCSFCIFPLGCFVWLSVPGQWIVWKVQMCHSDASCVSSVCVLIEMRHYCSQNVIMVRVSGWISRQQFEETWMSLLGVLNPLPSDTASTPPSHDVMLPFIVIMVILITVISIVIMNLSTKSNQVNDLLWYGSKTLYVILKEIFYRTIIYDLSVCSFLSSKVRTIYETYLCFSNCYYHADQ